MSDTVSSLYYLTAVWGKASGAFHFNCGYFSEWWRTGSASAFTSEGESARRALYNKFFVECLPGEHPFARQTFCGS
jgi:hypothetical protein